MQKHREMSYICPPNPRSRASVAAASLPPPAVEETAWDILLALHSDERSGVGLPKLAAVASVRPPNLSDWLALLEQRHLITGFQAGPDQEVRAVLTLAGRQLLDRYLAASCDLQVGAQH